MLHLAPLAREVSRRFQAEHPDEAERYGDAAFAWCVHDNQWLLGWAAEDLEIGGGHFAKNVRWIVRLLGARDYPVERIARDLEIAAEVVGDGSESRRRLAETLRAGRDAVPRSA